MSCWWSGIHNQRRHQQHVRDRSGDFLKFGDTIKHDEKDIDEIEYECSMSKTYFIILDKYLKKNKELQYVKE